MNSLLILVALAKRVVKGAAAAPAAVVVEVVVVEVVVVEVVEAVGDLTLCQNVLLVAAECHVHVVIQEETVIQVKIPVVRTALH